MGISVYPVPVAALRDFNAEVAKGNISGHSFIHKFGEAGDLDNNDEGDIWDGATDSITGFTKTLLYSFSTTADIDSISSSSGSDTTDLEIQGLDANWNLVVQTKTLNGQTRVALDTNLIRVFRLKNVGASAFAGNVFCYVDGGGLTAGVPNTEADVRAIIQIGNDQTLMAIYSIPNGKTGYLCTWYAALVGGTTMISNIKLRFRPEGGVFQLKHHSSLKSTGTSHIQHGYEIPEGPISARTDILLRADSNAANGAVSGGFDILLVDN